MGGVLSTPKPSLGLAVGGWREKLFWLAMVAMVHGGHGSVGLAGGGTGRGSCAPGRPWVWLVRASAALHWSRPDRPARRG